MRVVLWGVYDTGKPRTRIIRSALREAGIEVVEIHYDVWRGVEDKSQVSAKRERLRLLLAWLSAYPRLVARYLRAPAHDAVVITYPGHLDVLVLSPFALLRRRPVLWDAFLSLYDTVVLDRRMVGARHPVAWLLWIWEWLACRAATRVVLDTRAHADFFQQVYGLSEDRTGAVFVGAEPDVFCPDAAMKEGQVTTAAETTILFYGQFIPLHGIETIVRAAQAASDRPYRWILIGQGQEESRIRRLLEEGPATKLEWIPWVPFHELIGWISRADICLGIFGNSGKASRVIPNKVFQVLSAGRPLITRDSPATRELLSSDDRGVYLVPPADPEALVEAVERFRADQSTDSLSGGNLHGKVRERFSLAALGRSWSTVLNKAIESRAGAPHTRETGARLNIGADD